MFFVLLKLYLLHNLSLTNLNSEFVKFSQNSEFVFKRTNIKLKETKKYLHC